VCQALGAPDPPVGENENIDYWNKISVDTPFVISTVTKIIAARLKRRKPQQPPVGEAGRNLYKIYNFSG